MTTRDLPSALTGLNSFPVTPFGPDGRPDLDRYATHLEHQAQHGAATIFPACGTGEYAALAPDEYADVVTHAAGTVGARLPVVAGVGTNRDTARSQLAVAEKAGCAGALLLPPYLAPGDDAGLERHYRDVADSTDLPVILYVRPEAPMSANAILRLCELDNVIGVKDGTGRPELLSRLAASLDHTRVLINGMPTAELSAPVFAGIGVTGYSSAVYNFVPDIAVAFRQAVQESDRNAQRRLLDTFYLPFGALRDRRRGYAVSLVKAGVSMLLGTVGDPRPPLPSVDDDTANELHRVVDSARETIGATA
jgi:5-dehydro-4-deoxyglucarate dehydratase